MNKVLYLLHERRFIRINKEIYKLGVLNLNKFNNNLWCLREGAQYWNNYNDYKYDQIMQLFRENYIHRSDIGKQYFEGDRSMMVKDIEDVANNIIDAKCYDLHLKIIEADMIMNSMTDGLEYVGDVLKDVVE
jgi:hypothetical protein